MLKKLRITLAVLFFVGITLLLVGTGLHWWGWSEDPGVSSQLGWMAKLQFLPSLLAGNFIVVAALVLLTLVFGRIYCSVICPLGVMQDAINWLSEKFHKKKARKAAIVPAAPIKDPMADKRAADRSAVESLKAYVSRDDEEAEAAKAKELALKQELARLEAEGIREAGQDADSKNSSAASYINQGRVVRKPAPVDTAAIEARKKAAHEAFVAKLKQQHHHYHKEMKVLRYAAWAIYVAVLLIGIQAVVALFAPYSAYGRIVRGILHPAQAWVVTLIAAVTLVALVVIAWTSGRAYCNTICPVGTTLSFFSRFAMFRPMIDTAMCKGCGSCEKACKAHCIDSQARKIDYSRCVDCFSCISSCPQGGVKYKFAYAKPAAKASGTDEGRRAFMTGAVMAGTAVAAGSLLGEVSAAAQNMKVDGGLAEIAPKKAPKRETPVVPAGSGSVKDFYKHCTACQLCVANCPNNVLRPSTDIAHLMQPQMGFERGFCRPECTKCSQVCPAGAIKEVTPEQKTEIRIGHAVVNLDLCIANVNDESCGTCASHCPAGAIKMVKKNPDDEKSVRIPTANAERCIGCGKCEFLCPARPISAIHIEGNETHQTTE